MGERVGLLGWPVEHSVSPAMHQAAFAALGLDWRYDLLPVLPEGLEECVGWWLAEGCRGFNVTVPHKQTVLSLPYIRKVDSAVEATGAANTLVRLPSGGLRAANTDWCGFRDDLCAHDIDVRGATCLVLGTGGSAQGVAYALRQMGADRVVAVSRSPDRAQGHIGYDEIGGFLPAVSLIVNCTPVGMSPGSDASPWPDGLSFPEHAILYDLVYAPPVTRLMAQARSAGARAVGGLGMLVRQGAASFAEWTGIAPPLDVIAAAARQALSERYADQGAPDA